MSDTEDALTTDVEEIKLLPKGEIEVAFDGPAFSANRVFITRQPLGVRLAFIEHSPEAGNHFRTAAYLPMNDALALRDLLVKMLKDVKIEPGEADGDDRP